MNTAEPDLKAIFCEALEHAAGAERSAYLDEACGADATFRGQLESLLKAHDEAGGFLGSAAKGPSAPAGSVHDATVDQTPEPNGGLTVSLDRPAIAEGPGTTIGPYKLLQKIGEGGMGAVFMAEQTQPVRRRVALKVIKPGMDTGQVVARFEAERQALAMMDHQNIAREAETTGTAT